MNGYTRLLLACLLDGLGQIWQRTRDPGGVSREAPFPAAWRAVVGAALGGDDADPLTRLRAFAADLARGGRGAPAPVGRAAPAALQSLLSLLDPDEGIAPGRGAVYYPAPLALSEVLFPRSEPLSERERAAADRRLWDALHAELERVKPTATDADLALLFSFLQKYGWAVPAPSADGRADVSVFDQTRVVGALAGALYRSGGVAELEQLEAGDADAWQAKRFTLLGGDITGVQGFLYTITARAAARGLRGRSFYLQLVGEAIARWLLRRLDLALPHLLYVGGGRFYLLTHRLGTDTLGELRRYLDRALLAAHAGDLYVALGSLDLSARDFTAGPGFGTVWSALGQRLSEQKRHKFSTLRPDELHAAVFQPAGAGGPDEGCRVCRRAEPERVAPDEEPRCGLCRSFEDLGAELRDAKALYLGAVEPELPAGRAQSFGDPLRAFGLVAWPCSDEAELRRRARELGAGTLLWLDPDFLNDATLAARRATGGRLALGFTFLANVTPRRGDRIADFEDLATAAEGVPRLGVLRMDVDDLGALFGRGLGAGATLARVSGLSLLLRLYFEGWVSELARRHNHAAAGAADHIYTIYSGGDDLFIVGSWDRIATLAREIARDFGRFAGGNPAVHLSGGIALVDPHFPVHQAAELAGEALEAAKRREEGGRVVKNGLTFLGQTLGWPDVEHAAQRQAELVQLVEGGAPRALVHTLARVYREYETARRTRARGGHPAPRDQVPYGRWLWLSAYALGRLAERLKWPASEQVRALQHALVQPETIRTLGLAARWAELLLRREEERR